MTENLKHYFQDKNNVIFDVTDVLKFATYHITDAAIIFCDSSRYKNGKRGL